MTTVEIPCKVSAQGLAGVSQEPLGREQKELESWGVGLGAPPLRPSDKP